MTDREEQDRIIMHKAVQANLRQLSLLLAVTPLLDDDELAHRMAMKPKDIRAMLKLLRVTRG